MTSYKQLHSTSTTIDFLEIVIKFEKTVLKNTTDSNRDQIKMKNPLMNYALKYDLESDLKSIIWFIHTVRRISRVIVSEFKAISKALSLKIKKKKSYHIIVPF